MEIPRGELTKTVYTLIKDGMYGEAIDILQSLVDEDDPNRAGLSLLGYCYYHSQMFEPACSVYERLSSNYPEIHDYKVFYAQSLYNHGSYEDAMKVVTDLLGCELDEESKTKMLKLQAAIHYTMDETEEAQAAVEKLDKKTFADADAEIGLGCIDYKNGNYMRAFERFLRASMMVDDTDPQLLYNKAVTSYRLADFPTAFQLAGDILMQGIISNPELGVSFSQVEDSDLEARTEVTNSRTLQSSAVIEALNLKAAIELELGKINSAQTTIKSLPPRKDEDVDPITLHNLAILFHKDKGLESIRKLRFLLDQPVCPPEAFENLLIIYGQFQQYDLIADLMAVYEEPTKNMSPYMHSYFEAMTKLETSTDESVKILTELTAKLIEENKKILSQIPDVKVEGTSADAKRIMDQSDDIVDGIYGPALMMLGKIYWDREDLTEVEKILQQGSEVMNDRDCWMTNVAHVMFIRNTNLEGASGFYEMVMKKYTSNLLDMSAISLANLCTIYVRQGDKQCNVIREEVVEEENRLLEVFPEVKVFHGCILNLVLGTFYCVSKDFDTGISMIIKSFENDLSHKLGPDTWFYTKRVFLSMLERIVKNSIAMKETILIDCVYFLKSCEDVGRDITTVIVEKNSLEAEEGVPMNYGTQTVTYEARILRRILMQILDVGIIVTTDADDDADADADADDSIKMIADK